MIADTVSAQSQALARGLEEGPPVSATQSAALDALAVLPARPTREQVDRLETEMLRLEAEGLGVPLSTSHQFANGLVARTIFIPAGTCLTGAAHKFEHLNICQGDITVWTDEGMRRLTGYHVLPARPGTKRVGAAHADTWWTTVHLNENNERDISAIEDALVHGAERLQTRRLALPLNTTEIPS